MTGNPQNPGILSRSLDTIFNSIQGRQCRKFTFKPDGQNGFEILSSADAIIEWQKEKMQQQRILQVTPRTPVKRRAAANANADELKDWDKRERDDTTVELPSDTNNMYSVFVSYVEIYNNYIYDLLDDTVFDQIKLKQPQSKILREDSRKKVFVLNGVELEVRNANEANELFIKGIKRRRIAQTALNAESSRSHSVFNIKVVQAPRNKDEEIVMDSKYMNISQLSLVDLAGSERTGRTQTTGDRLKEASSINNSLMTLRNCIDILRENQKNSQNQNKLVPYRDNKLTHLFKSYFEGEGQIKMVICVSPGSDDYTETLQVMKFAEAAQEVMVKKAQNSALFTKYDVGTTCPFNLAYPSTNYSNAADDKIFPDWMESMDQRRKIKDGLSLSLGGKLDLFRNSLCEMEKENMMAKQQMNMYRSDLDARTFQIKRLEEQIADQKKTIEVLSQRDAEFDVRVRQLENELSQKDFLINQHEIELQRVTSSLKEKFNAEYQRMKAELRRALKDKQGRIERELCLQKEKAELVREILGGDINLGFLRECRESVCPESAEIGIKSDPNLLVGGTPRKTATSNATPIQSSNSANRTPHSTGTPKMSTNFATSNQIFATYTANTDRVAVTNPRHRRSLSTGNERWVDHKPLGTIDLGTVFKPKIKNCKSISNLTEIPTEKLISASNYALTHHVATPDGEVETHVYKADVIPSSMGGAQVIFNDVEMLRQVSPQVPRKRTSSISHVIGVDQEMLENKSPVKSSPMK